MSFKVGDIVSRISYNNDILFKIIDITDDIVTLKGVDLRLYADSEIEDLKKEEGKLNIVKEDRKIINENLKSVDLNRDEYFYLPGKILHIDTEFQLTNTLANPYKIRKKAIFENCKNHQK